MVTPTPIEVIAAEAKFYSVGVWCRLIPWNEIAKWLDTRLREYNPPPSWLKDVARSITPSSSCYQISVELDSLAGDLGIAKLPVSDVRRLLGWLAQAIDAKRFSPFDAGMALRWIVEHVPPNEPIIEEMLAARTRFSIRRCRHHRLKQAWRELRQWCEYASLDPAAN